MEEREFMRLAIDKARDCKPEDERIHPRVGVVIARDNELLDFAYRGELSRGDHAEFTILEKKLGDQALAGTTVYVTLEPCTTRNHPKISCAQRLIEHRVAKVFIGMLDPNPAIHGNGQDLLREAGIEVGVFPGDLTNEILELNREF